MKYILYILTFVVLQLNAQQLAFPSAIGAGAYTTGGRDGIVLHVTKLDDILDVNNPNYVGTLRWALSQNYNRYIVFDVSGIIVLQDLLGIYSNNSNVTIAGQTAPEGGITIDGDRFYLNNVDNIIVRYIRFKGGVDADRNPNLDDNLGNDSVSAVENITNQIWDHCTFGFGADEAASWYTSIEDAFINNITIQRCLFIESPRGSILGKEEGNYNESGKISFIFNMFYNSGYRYPNIAGTNYNFDIINNVTWGQSGRLIRGNGGFNLNHINNYNDFGDNLEFPVKDQTLQLFGYNQIPNIYTNGNKIVASVVSSLTNSISDMNANNKLSWKRFNFGSSTYGDQLPSYYFTSTQHIISGPSFTILSADETIINVRKDVGCNARLNSDGSVGTNLDVLDLNALNQVASGNYVTPLNLNTDYNVTPINSISRSRFFYNSSDHIPEIWFIANVPEGKNYNDIAPSGYSWLEEYLNQIDIDSNTNNDSFCRLCKNLISN
ncbi:hypothetical protein [Winogradskyella sp. PG-2]|uniref:hypothetical protein n=1 Tax=Winogradskyella sp. PG-2 TaxID=754409 RepID=UPI00045898BA|nr:hypothetical protein [Winogradskyella sp. PG-2]BAO75538.1 pectate lyase [Winogradskyella sp. PG-2]